MIKIKKQANLVLAILMAITSFNLSPIKALEQNQSTTPNTNEVSKEASNESEEKQKKENTTEISTEEIDDSQPTNEVDNEEKAQKENLGNEPPNEEKNVIDTPKIVSKNEDGFYTDIITKEKIDANRVQIQMVNPLETLDVEIWIKSEIDGTFSKKKVSEFSEYEKNKYSHEIEQASNASKLRSLRSSAELSIGDYTGYSVQATAADGVHSDWSSDYQILLIDGEPGFCVQPGIIFVPGNDFTPSNYDNYLLSVIAYEGWEQSDKSSEAYLATQLMIWEALGGTINSTSFSAYETYKLDIQYKIDHHNDKPIFSENKYEINVGESISIHDNNNVLNKFFIEETDGLNVRISGNDLIITGTIDAKDEASIELQKIDSQYVGTSIVYRKPGSQEAAKFMIHDPILFILDIKVNKFGSLAITKQDEDGSKVANTSFLASRNADMSNPLGTYTTGNDGSVKVDEILPGTIYVQETAVPDHLVLDNTIKPVKIVANTETAYTATNNFVKGKVEIQKKDIDTGQNVFKSNAQFDIYKTDGTFMETVTTNTNGTAISSLLRYGDYFFVEKSAPELYTKNANRIYFNIRTNGTVVKSSISNKRTTGSITLNKVDGVTGAAQGDATLDGAVYGLYAYTTITSPDDNHVIYAKDALISRLTIINGTVSISDLYLGNYYIKEITPSLGYTLDPTSYVVTLNYADQNTVNIHKDQTVKERVMAQAFEIIKIASGVTTDPSDVPTLEGAEFTIKLKSKVDALGWDSTPIAKNAQGNPASILVTDKKGYALSDELPYGVYQVRETKTPVNHETVPDFYITVHKDSRTPQSWRILNDKPFEAMLKVVKYDSETGETISLSNATFKIKNLTTGEYLKQWIWYPIPHEIDEFTTSSDGSFYTPALMMYGKYQLEEIKTPDGYLTLENPVQFEIGDAVQVEPGPDGKTPVIKVEVPNDPIKGQISLKKEAEIFKGYDFRQTEHGLIYEPLFEKGLLAGVNYQITAAEDILTNDKTLWYSKGDIVDNFVTAGEYLSALLPLGEYNLQEVATIDGYVLDDTIYNISITAEDNVTKIILHAEEKWNDKQRGSISFEKALEESAYITKDEAYKDITFGLFAEEPIVVNGEEVVPVDGLLGVIGLNEKLEGTFGLDFKGKYYIKELTTNNQYVLDDTKHSFEYVYGNETLTEIKLDKTIENKLKRGSIELQKTENKENEVLADATFALADDRDFNNILFEKVTDENGKINFGNLEIGTYYLKESKAPDNYMLDPTVREIIINEDAQNIEINVANLQKGSITIHKKDNENLEALAGAEFVLATDKEFKEIIQTGTSDSNGNIRFDHLDHGQYFYKETKAPEGFELDPIVHEITIDEVTTDIEVEHINTKIRGSIEIIKISNEPYPFIQDATKIPEYLESLKDENSTKNTGQKFYLEGVEFVLATDKEFKEIIQTGFTDKNGKLSFEGLEEGTYYWKESKGLEGFVLDPIVHKIVITKHGQHETYDVENIVRRSWIEVSKEDAITRRKLPFAGFTLYADPECTIELKKSESGLDGIAVFDGLLNGTYYFKETSAPEGYILSDEIVKVVIDTNKPAKAYKITYYNNPLQDDVQTSINNIDISLWFCILFLSSTGIGIYLKKSKKAK